MTTILLLSISAIITATISAITGMGGGILLLTVMTFFLPINFIVPIHGVAQLVSNFSRTLYLRKSVKKEFVLPFVFGAPFGAALAAFFLKGHLSPQHIKLLLAFLILYAVFKPKKLPSLKVSPVFFFPIGICAGVLGILVGAVGPFLAPFFLRDDFKKEEIIATKSALQIFTHFLKIPTFLYLGFSYQENLDLILALVVSVFIGTTIGVKVLKNIPEELFKKIFKTLLTLAAIRLIYGFITKG